MNSLRQNDVEAQVEIDGLVKWVDRCDSVVVRKKMVNKSIRKDRVRARVLPWSTLQGGKT